jgi:hypothetical protein
MVKIIGLTHPAPPGRGYPSGEEWPEEVVNEMIDECLGFYVATGEIFDPYEKDIGRKGYQKYWWFIEDNYHPVFDQKGHYQTYYRGGTRCKATVSEKEELSLWLGLLD